MEIKKAERKNWFYSYNAIFDMAISIHSKMLYLYLCRCADSTAMSFPSRQRIMRHCSMGRTSVGNALRELEKVRLLKRENRYRENNSQTSNRYTIYPEAYEGVMQKNKG